MTVRLKVDARGLEILKALPAELVSKRGGPIRRALRKACGVFLRHEKVNLQRIIDETKARQGGETQSIGLIMKSLRVTRGKPPLSGKGERYLVRVLPNLYPRRTTEKVLTLKSAELLEYGREGQPPRPWVRKAYIQGQAEAAKVFKDYLNNAIDQIVARHKRGR